MTEELTIYELREAAQAFRKAAQFKDSDTEAMLEAANKFDRAADVKEDEELFEELND